MLFIVLVWTVKLRLGLQLAVAIRPASTAVVDIYITIWLCYHLRDSKTGHTQYVVAVKRLPYVRASQNTTLYSWWAVGPITWSRSWWIMRLPVAWSHRQSDFLCFGWELSNNSQCNTNIGSHSREHRSPVVVQLKPIVFNTKFLVEFPYKTLWFLLFYIPTSTRAYHSSEERSPHSWAWCITSVHQFAPFHVRCSISARYSELKYTAIGGTLGGMLCGLVMLPLTPVGSVRGD